MSDESVDFKPLVSFPDQSDSFVHGFEAGMIWQQMQDGASPIGTHGLPYHTENVEVIKRMADAAGYQVIDVTRVDDCWTSVVIDKLPQSKAAPKFTVIQGGLAAVDEP
jgi:hypothetical protein